jgi:hypothetical protein
VYWVVPQLALKLPTKARAAAADSFLENPGTGAYADAEEVWQREMRRRMAELDSKVVSPLRWFEVRSRLMARLKNVRPTG